MSNWGSVALENIAEELKNIREILEKQLEQSPRVGEWIIDEPPSTGHGTIYTCPLCGHEEEFEPTNYCPACGAKMKG